MTNLTFLYEENGYTVSKLTVHGTSFFFFFYKATGRRYIRKSLVVVDQLVRGLTF